MKKNSIQALMIAGNHLASQLWDTCDPTDLKDKDYNFVINKYGVLVADIWVAWMAIMYIRDNQENLMSDVEEYLEREKMNALTK